MAQLSRRVRYIWIPGLAALAVLTLGDLPRAWLEETTFSPAVSA